MRMASGNLAPPSSASAGTQVPSSILPSSCVPPPQAAAVRDSPTTATTITLPRMTRLRNQGMNYSRRRTVRSALFAVQHFQHVAAAGLADELLGSLFARQADADLVD